jgi:hypothetical protein
VFERQMDDAIGLGRAAMQAVEIIKAAPMHLRPGGGERSRRSLRSGQPDDLMTCVDELGNNGRADPAGRASDEYTHENVLRVVDERAVMRTGRM